MNESGPDRSSVPALDNFFGYCALQVRATELEIEKLVGLFHKGCFSMQLVLRRG